MIKIICREVNKNNGKIIIYPLDIKVDNQSITMLSIRSTMNPELTYYAVSEEHYKQHKSIIVKILKSKNIKGELKHFDWIEKIY